jgi:aminoglycoside 6'-N-acetyltransferase
MPLPWDFHALEGELITLDLMKPTDLEALYTLHADPEVTRYLLHDVRSRDEVARILERDAAATRLEKTDDYVQPAIRDRSGRLIGTMYFRIASVDDRTAEVGWLLSPNERGKGYATDAARALLRLAFDEIGLHRVYAELDPRNTASIALCERLGMRHETHIVEHMWLKGEWTDTGGYAILEREWAARRDRAH